MKANRALFSIKQSIFFSGIFNKTIKPSPLLHIFDVLVKPIASHNSDIWSAYKSCFKNKSVKEMFELSLKNINEFDKIYTHGKRLSIT